MRRWLSRFCAAFALVLATSAAFAQTTPFVNESLGDQAIRLEGEMKTLVKPGTRKAPAWAKLGQEQFDRGEYQRAVESYSAAAILTARAGINWIKLAEAMLEIADGDSANANQIRSRASALAYLGYQRVPAPTDKAAALALVGRALAGQGSWRPALNAYRASLALADDAEVRTTYEELRDEHGFRVVDNSVDSDALNPRACVRFSDPLANAKSDYSSYVAIKDGAQLTVTAKDEQLCVDGLKHGERYAFTVRAGVPSTVGEVLEKPFDLSFFVRDRKPEIRFTGRNYVLPRTGQRGIPLNSVNTDTVKIDIYRIGDRGLVADIVGEEFQTQIAGYQAEELAETKGSKIWSGELAVERQQNLDVTTAFPVDTTVGPTAPGVYVMVAQPKAKATDDEEYGNRATQWFIVSDLGLSSFTADSGLVAIVRSLASATPVADADVRILAKNNEVLATAKTDADGIVSFPGGLVRGSGGSAPAVLVAETKDRDYAFLDLTQPGFDLADRGVAGREAAGPIDAFVYTERGVYRPGETVHATVLARDAQANALPDVPLTLVAERPDGVEYRRALVADQGLGGRVLDLPIQGTAMTGTWRLRAYADPKRPPVGEAKFLVEDYVPDRIEVNAEPISPVIARQGKSEIAVSSRYLYGAPASGLQVDGEVTVDVADEAPGDLKGYRFGIEDDEITAVTGQVESVALDAEGKATASVSLTELPDTAQPLEAAITIRVTEAGGRAVSRTVKLPVARAGQAIGVKPLFKDQVPDGELARFDVLVAAPDGKLLDRPALSWSLLKVTTRFQWFSEGGSWRSESVESTSRVASGTVAASASGPVRIEAPATYGSYRLEVGMAGADATVTSVAFDAGWYAEASAETPDLVRLVLDKPSYAVGEEATLTLEPRFAGRATIVVVGSDTRVAKAIEVEGKPAEVKIPVDAAWGAGAYAVALLHRPLDVAAGRMPGRAVGVAWIGADKAPRTLGLKLDTPAVMEPRNRMTIPLGVVGLTPGEQAYVTVAAVDVGILNLTRFKAPAPEDWFYAQRKLGTEIRDLYGQLIDGMKADAGAVRSGGDGGEDGITGPPPTEAPVALFSGMLQVGSDGKAEVGFDIPPFNGTVRVMAVAWSRTKVGHAEADVIVRDPVVVTATLPRFLAAGDRSTLRFDFANVTGQPGSHQVVVSAEGPVSLPPAELSRSLDLPLGGRGAASLAVTGTGVGVATIDVTVTAPDGKIMERSYSLGVRPTLPDISRRTVTALAPRTGSIQVSSDLLADFVPGSGAIALSVAPSSAIDVPALLRELDRYPYGCSEQITSRAMPLLYVNELAKAVALPIDAAIDDRIRDSIERLLTRQSGSGGFGLWSTDDDDIWLNAYVTDFLTRAREKGFTVPETAVTSALDQLRNQLSYSSDFEEGKGAGVAYSLYVLARNGRAPLGDLRYYSEEKLDSFGTSLARAQIGGALALLGDTARARKAIESARTALNTETNRARDDYGSILRDRAAVLTLVSESGAVPSLVPVLLRDIATERAKRRYTSTQENAWLVMAARALTDAAQRLELTVDGTPNSGPYSRTLKEAEIAGNPLSIQNRGSEEASAIVTVSGSPKLPEPPAEEGFTISRKYFGLDGKEVTLGQVKQTTRLVVVLEMTEAKPESGNVLVVDRLPAGFEIDNPRLADSDSLKAFTWLKDAAGDDPVHTEFRDDRFVAAYKRDDEDRPAFSVAYVIRAVAPGQYIHPPATVEDMYRPERFARTDAGRVEVTAGQ